MCGIYGTTLKDANLAEAAAKSFCYRGPDAFSLRIDDGVIFAHNRLSIIDLDPRSTQPMLDENNENSIVFNGEIYNYAQLKQLVPEYKFRTTSDTEVILALYNKFGAEFLKYLSGMFALAIHDKKKAEILIARDHGGIKPLYYTLENKEIIFASEMKGIVTAKEGKAEIDRDAIDLYFTLGYVPTPKTIYKNIFKLPPGTFAVFGLPSRTLSTPTKFNPDVPVIKNEEELFKQIEEAIVAHTIADVPVGIFFSGGIDSSLISAVLHARGIDLNAYSITMEHKSNDEYYSKKIAEHLGFNYKAEFFGPKEFEEVYDTVMSHIDEPIYDMSLFPTYFVSRIASKDVKVVLSGEGGDENFYGYERHLVMWSLREKFDANFDVYDSIYFALPEFRGKSVLARKIYKLIGKPFSYYLLEMGQLPNRNGFKLAKQIISNYTNYAPHLDLTTYLENDLLRKTDMATSYNSIEGRVPLLAPTLFSVNEEIESAKLRNGNRKALLKKLLKRYLPEELVERPKSGFSINVKSICRNSAKFQTDLKLALEYLKKENLLPNSIIKNPDLTSRLPYVAFMCIALYRSIKNTQ